MWFFTAVQQLTRFQLAWSVAWFLCDSWASFSLWKNCFVSPTGYARRADVVRNVAMVEEIAKPIPIPTPVMNSLQLVNAWDVVVRLQVGGCHVQYTHVCVVFTRVYGLIFTNLSASIEQVVDFIMILAVTLPFMALDYSSRLRRSVRCAFHS